MWQLSRIDLTSVAVGGTAILGAIVNVRAAIVISRRSRASAACEPEATTSAERRIDRAEAARERSSPITRLAVALVEILIAGLVFAHLVSPGIAYAVLCLSLVANYIVDLISEERARRRRAAILQRSRGVDPALMTWIVIAAASPLLLFQYFLAAPNRIAAIVVACCVVAMAAIAWRIASALPILLGDDLVAEQRVDQATRTDRTGYICVLAIGVVFVFACFVNQVPGTANDRIILPAVFAWIGIFLWRLIYARRLSRALLSSEAK